MLTVIISLVLTVIIFYYYFVFPLNYWKNKGVKQCKPVWIFGDSWGPIFRIMSVSEMIKHVYDQASNVRYFGMYQFVKPALVIKNLELIKQITVKDFDHFTDHRAFVPETVDPLWGRNIISLRGQDWRDMRSILSPAFTSSKMKQMFVLITECAESFVRFFLENDQNPINVEMKDVFTRLTNDIIASTAFGIKIDSLREPNNVFYLAGKDVTNFSGFFKILTFCGYAVCPKLMEFFNIKLFSKEATDYFQSVIEDTIKTREKQGIKRPDMIHLLLESREGVQKHEENQSNLLDTGFATAVEEIVDSGNVPKFLSNVDIVAQALGFFFAGFDAVSSIMSFMSYELAVNQDIQDKLRSEVKDTLKNCKEKLTYEALLKMSYMDMVVSETLRKYPTNIATDRICTKPYTIQPVTTNEMPVDLKVGDELCLPIWALHRDPDYFPDPEKFNPERFNDENKKKIIPYSFMPFGSGPRSCIASRFALLETKAVFFYILSNFKIEPTKETIIPLVISKKSFTLTSEGGYRLALTRI